MHTKKKYFTPQHVQILTVPKAKQTFPPNDQSTDPHIWRSFVGGELISIIVLCRRILYLERWSVWQLDNAQMLQLSVIRVKYDHIFITFNSFISQQLRTTCVTIASMGFACVCGSSVTAYHEFCKCISSKENVTIVCPEGHWYKGRKYTWKQLIPWCMCVNKRVLGVLSLKYVANILFWLKF